MREEGAGGWRYEETHAPAASLVEWERAHIERSSLQDKNPSEKAMQPILPIQPSSLRSLTATKARATHDGAKRPRTGAQ